MKTIMKIVVILLVAAVVAGGFSLAVNNSSLAGTSPAEGGQPPALTNSSSSSITQTTFRPEGSDREGGSIAGGLADVVGTIAKLAGITAIVLLLEKAFSLLSKRGLISTQQ
jgi:hypothetical protein